MTIDTEKVEKAQIMRITGSRERFDVVATKVLEMRSVFLDQLNVLPVPFNEIIKDHYIARVVRAEDRYMLGEYAPFFLADIFHIPDSLTHNIVIPWLMLYEHSLLVDDIIDLVEE